RPSEWLRDHVAGPLNLAMTYGTDPTAQDFCPMLEPLPNTDPATAGALAELLSEPMVVRAVSLGGLFDPAKMSESANGLDYLTPEIPGGNLVTNARSLARLYAATVGEVDGIRLLGPGTVRDAAVVRSAGNPFVGPD